MTNRRLLLMRHAKSDWADASLSDHDRPLNRRGRRDAPSMAQWIKQSDVVPDQILCSSSARTRETAQILVDTWESDVLTRPVESLYLSSPETILNVIQTSGDDASTLLVIGHNPGMSVLVSQMAQRGIEMPTAAVAIFEVDVERWSHLDSLDGVKWLDFAKPKDVA